MEQYIAANSNFVSKLKVFYHNDVYLVRFNALDNCEGKFSINNRGQVLETTGFTMGKIRNVYIDLLCASTSSTG